MHQDITMHYLGLELRSPILVGACPLTLNPEIVRELAIAGAGAVVLPSLMEEQVIHWSERQRQAALKEERSTDRELCDKENDYNGGVGSYLNRIPILKHQCGIPIIASLNGYRDGDWLNIARDLEVAGADALEVSIAADACDPASTSDQVERPLLDAIQRVADLVSIPVSVKLLPFFTTLPNLGWRLAEVGAEGVVLFAREPVWEMVNGDLVPTSRWQLSSPGLLQTTLSGLMRIRSGGPGISVAASGGVSTTLDVVHCVTAGADVAMITSEVYRNGPDAVAHLAEGLSGYLARHQRGAYTSFVASCRQQSLQRTRRAQVEPMLIPPSEQAAREVNRQRGDRWGHPTESW